MEVSLNKSVVSGIEYTYTVNIKSHPFGDSVSACTAEST